MKDLIAREFAARANPQPAIDGGKQVHADDASQGTEDEGALQNLRGGSASSGKLSAIHHNGGGDALGRGQQVVGRADRPVRQLTEYTPGS